MKKTFVLLLLMVLLLTSCSSYVFYQVYNVTTPDMEERGNKLVYENEHLKVSYNFWGEAGDGNFVVYNKSDKDLFILLPQSFMIKNGIALDYFKNREWGSSVSQSLTANAGTSAAIYGYTKYLKDFQGNPYLASISSSAGEGKSIGRASSFVMKENPIVCIPPHASKVLGEYSLYDNLIKACNKEQDYPNKSAMLMTFTKEDSPLHVVNRIAYTFDSTGKASQYINNEFWISEVTNYIDEEIVETEWRTECEGGLKEEVEVFTIGSPRQFYNQYKGFPSKKVNADGISDKVKARYKISRKKNDVDDVYK